MFLATSCYIYKTRNKTRINRINQASPIFWIPHQDFISEYRVYVVDGEIRAICHYKGPEDTGAIDWELGDSEKHIGPSGRI